MIENIVNAVEKKTESLSAVKQGDYINEDGLLYCGNCHTKKQTRIFVFDKERVVPCICKCKEEEIREREERKEQEEFAKLVRRNRKVGFPESELASCTFSEDDMSNPELTKALMKYVENFDEFSKSGKGLLLYGSVGTGKTFGAACVANALIDKGVPVLMTNFARITNTVQGLFQGKQEYYDSLNRFPLLIIDDLATERKTEYMQEIVYNVIDARYRAKKPIIITTNLTSDELKHSSDVTNQRIFSRLFEMCHPIKVDGKDRRRKKLTTEFLEMNKMLGLGE